MLKKAFCTTVPVMTGYLVLGTGFGVLLRAKGYGVWWALAMSGFIYAGSMQYLAIDLLAGGASLVTAALTTLMVNARHLFYGISMVDRYRDMKQPFKTYAIFALTDETYSLVCQPASDLDAKEQHRYAFWVSLLNQGWWLLGTLIGSALGSVLPFDVTGVDFALTALFVTVFLEQWLSAKDHASALIGVGASLLCLLLFGPDGFLMPSMLLILLALTALRAFRGEAKA